jgi:hypothetical protein
LCFLFHWWFPFKWLGIISACFCLPNFYLLHILFF